MNNVLVVGLTGGLATGKTTVAEIFKSLGAIIIDADKIAREVVKPNSFTWQRLKDYFGTKILNDDLTINRKALSDLVFSNKTYRMKLNQFTHPTIIQMIKEEIEEIKNSGKAKIVIIDVPLLIEANMVSMVDKVIVATTSQNTQIRRVMKRDNLSKHLAKTRISSQMPLSEKVKLADFVINTDCPKTELENEVKAVWEKLNIEVI